MTEILPVFISSVILCWFSHMFSKYNPRINDYEQKEKLFYVIAGILMILFVGLRTRYNDTSNYISSYVYLVDENGTMWDKVHYNSLGSNPSFVLVRNILKQHGFSNQSFLLFFAVITWIPYLWFTKKYSNNIVLSIYLMFTVGVFAFTCAAIKQCLAIGFGLLGIDAFIKNKKFWFVFWIIVGATFHPYVLMFLIAPFITFKPWTRKTYYMLGIFAVMGVALQLLVGRIVDITSMMGEEYTADSFSGAGVNPFRAAVCLVPVVLSFVVRKNIDEDYYDKKNSLLLHLTFLNGLIMFLALFGTANYFGRLANYFLIFSVISIPWLLKYVDQRYRSFVFVAAVVLYFIYFYYESINGGVATFNQMYDRISLKEYLQSLK